MHTQSNLWLGEAREAKRDTAGACQAYAVVLSRWGNAIPRSISADEARAPQQSARLQVSQTQPTSAMKPR